MTAAAQGRATREKLVASARITPGSLASRTHVGALLLAPPSTCDPKWLPTFGTIVPGADSPFPSEENYVFALATFDDGHGAALYAGGSFRSIGGLPVNSIARWNGVRWSALGDGVEWLYWPGRVWALAVFDDGGARVLHAGGSFTTAGGLAAKGVARWDGSGWSALAGGVSTGTGSSSVRAPAVFDDGSGATLCAGGSFTISPGRDSHLARWGCGRRVEQEARR